MTLEELMAKRPRAPFEASLRPEAVTEFNERGFTSIERITTDEEIEWLREVYDAFFAPGTELLPGQRIEDVLRPIDAMRDGAQSQVLKPELRLSELRDTTFWQNGKKLASQLLNADAERLEGWGHLVRKTPRDPEALPWHQDEAFWDTRFDYHAVSCWMPLDPASVESGCMSFIPGSHTEGIRRHRFINNDPLVTALVAEDVDESLAVPQPVPIGGASFHHCRTLHGSGPNLSDRQRRAYVNEFQLVPARRDTPADRPWVKHGLDKKLENYAKLAAMKSSN
jgi:hypothetical protein